MSEREPRHEGPCACGRFTTYPREIPPLADGVLHLTARKVPDICEVAALRSENERLRGEVAQVASDYQDLGQKWNDAEAALSEAREVLRWVANNYRATLGRRSVRDADECLAAADRLLAPPPEASGTVYRDNGEGWGTDE